ncbi:Response regulator receiver protein [Olavius sp. associated proteobacterium Delta 1]|nr:Response regulator receiver protein [Olavius sp. associated proteobacterium Delta 1]
MSLANVLLVDDEVSFVETFSERLVMRNLDITKAFSGEEALQTLENKNDIEVVVLDVKMPGMDGIETLTEIKKKYPLVEVIMLSGHADVESAIDGMKQGAFDYLMKPSDIDQIVAKVTDAAAKKRSHEEKIIQARIKEITSRRT